VEKAASTSPGYSDLDFNLLTTGSSSYKEIVLKEQPGQARAEGYMNTTTTCQLGDRQCVPLPTSVAYIRLKYRACSEHTILSQGSLSYSWQV